MIKLAKLFYHAHNCIRLHA